MISPRLKLLKRILTWVVVLCVLGGGTYAALQYRKQTAVAEPKFRTVKIDKGNIAAKVTATGTLSARVTVQVGAQVSGRLLDIFVDFNSQVKKGQVIAKLDPLLFQAALARARASTAQARGQLDKAKVNLAQAERTLERTKKLHSDALAGEADVEAAQTAVDAAKSDVSVANGALAQAAASLNEAQVNLGFTTILSPIDGIVLTRSVDVGQTVAASLSAPVLFTIAQDLKMIQVDTYVSEADVGKLQKGMEATFTVDAYPGQKFKGTIRDVRNASQTVQNVVTYDAVLDVANDDLKLKPGMTANVTFVYAEATDALTVPNAALRFSPPASAMASGSNSAGGRRGGGGGPPGGGRRKPGEEGSTRRVLWVPNGDLAVSKRVEIGVTDGSYTEIKSQDLQAGDEIIVESLVTETNKTTTSSPLGGTPQPQRGGRGF